MAAGNRRNVLNRVMLKLRGTQGDPRTNSTTQQLKAHPVSSGAGCPARRSVQPKLEAVGVQPVSQCFHATGETRWIAVDVAVGIPCGIRPTIVQIHCREQTSTLPRRISRKTGNVITNRIRSQQLACHWQSWSRPHPNHGACNQK